MSEKNYYESQIEKLGVINDTASVRFTSETGETNFMSLNKHSIPVFIKLLEARLEAFKPKEAESPKDERATSTVEMTIRELLHYNTQLPVYIGLHNHLQEFAVDDIFTIIENSANNRIIIETWQDFKLSDTQKEKLHNLFLVYANARLLHKGDYFAQIEAILANP